MRHRPENNEIYCERTNIVYQRQARIPLPLDYLTFDDKRLLSPHYLIEEQLHEICCSLMVVLK